MTFFFDILSEIISLLTTDKEHIDKMDVQLYNYQS
ncbi:hypothetical protein CoNPh17_CDS0231 [Staphylococcus phage S-CoN_Ph17]|nr:hypothetical protein CoNPh17_CDS0231 [Staphylococcus phage S-CoN_Ph17]